MVVLLVFAPCLLFLACPLCLLKFVARLSRSWRVDNNRNGCKDGFGFISALLSGMVDSARLPNLIKTWY